MSNSGKPASCRPETGMGPVPPNEINATDTLIKKDVVIYGRHCSCWQKPLASFASNKELVSCHRFVDVRPRLSSLRAGRTGCPQVHCRVCAVCVCQRCVGGGLTRQRAVFTAAPNRCGRVQQLLISLGQAAAHLHCILRRCRLHDQPGPPTNLQSPSLHSWLPVACRSTAELRQFLTITAATRGHLRAAIRLQEIEGPGEPYGP